jgi:glycosyltransferase involved in cell wall biosynthesis
VKLAGSTAHVAGPIEVNPSDGAFPTEWARRPKILEVATLSKFLDWFLLPLADRLRDRGWQVDGMASGAPYDPTVQGHFDRLFDIAWSRSLLDVRGMVAAALQLRRLVEQERYDVVHVHTPIAAFLTRLTLRRARARRSVRVVYTAHGFHFHEAGHPLKNLAYVGAERLAGRWTDALVLINDEDFAAARRHGIVPESRLHHIAGIGVDTRHYTAAAVPDEAVAAFRAEIGVDSTTPLVLCIAELIPRKRHKDLLDAFAAVMQRNAHLVLAGDGTQMVNLRQQARALRLASRTHFLGHRRDVPVLIRAADVVVLVSEQEGLPRCLMESLSMETPVIATDVRGSRQLVSGAGQLVPVGDIGAIASAIEWSLDRRKEAVAQARAGRERVLRRHSEALVLDQYDSLLTGLLASAEARPAGPLQASDGAKQSR